MATKKKKKQKKAGADIVSATDFHWRPTNDVYGKAVEDVLSKLLRRLKVIGGKVFIFEGDFFHNLRMSIADLRRLQRFFAKIVSFGYQVIVFDGNHEMGLDESPLSLVSDIPGVLYVNNISSIVQDFDGKRVRMIFVPFSKSSGTKAFDEEVYEKVEPAIELAKKKNEKVILFGHYQIGSPKIREDYRYKDLKKELPYIAGVDLYCLGHIHLHQEYKIKGTPVIYPGSISKVNFGEKKYKNGFVKIQRDLSWEFEEIPSRDMVEIIVKGDITEGEIKDKYAGKIVKLIIQTKDVDLKRLKVKFEKHALVANIIRRKTTGRRIKTLKDITSSKYNPLSVLKGALKKIDISEKGRERVFELGKKIIKEALQ